jgi:hypothetical protein
MPGGARVLEAIHEGASSPRKSPRSTDQNAEKNTNTRGGYAITRFATGDACQVEPHSSASGTPNRGGRAHRRGRRNAFATGVNFTPRAQPTTPTGTTGRCRRAFGSSCRSGVVGQATRRWRCRCALLHGSPDRRRDEGSAAWQVYFGYAPLLRNASSHFPPYDGRLRLC